MRDAVLSVLLLLVSTLMAAGVCEGVLRIKNASMRNYDIEMWRYARELKVRSDNPLLGHEHVASREALLQSVIIRTNERGLRGPALGPLSPGTRRILFLGSSVTLGWGVPEEDTLTGRLQRMFDAGGDSVQVLNAGIGNYNTTRYVERFLTELADLEPTDLVVHYFLRDAEILEAGSDSWLLRNSELAATLWIAATRALGSARETTLVEHYRRVYEPSAPGFQEMERQLARLAAHARAHDARLYLAMTPDVHQLVDYPYESIHARMAQLAARHGYAFVDLLPALRGLTPEQIWAMPRDPHPNALGHERMAQALYPALQLAPAQQAASGGRAR